VIDCTFDTGLCRALGLISPQLFILKRKGLAEVRLAQSLSFAAGKKAPAAAGRAMIAVRLATCGRSGEATGAAALNSQSAHFAIAD
jgi:hypothetical protein